jgi:NAD(P)-dependent dehydrogenase (short-subunit alcohol dehydrogenase family)
MTQRLLEGDSALVTGAAQGIGRAVADALEEEGACVLRSDLGDCDLTRPGSAQQLAETATRTFGKVSIFVHCACPRRQESETALAVSEMQWREMLEVNLNAGFLIAQALARHMRDAGIRGRMLFLTSLHAASPRNLPHYSAAKAGQTMVVRELARALGPHGIRVNAIAPGAIPGGGFNAAASGLDRLAACTALGRLGTPADVAGMALALLCDRFSAYVTGTTVVVDGGIALHNWLPPPAD